MMRHLHTARVAKETLRLGNNFMTATPYYKFRFSTFSTNLSNFITVPGSSIQVNNFLVINVVCIYTKPQSCGK